jgi:hypothetical protein
LRFNGCSHGARFSDSTVTEYGCTGTPDDFGGNDLQSTTQQHIVMVENDQNEGEYKVFHLTSSVDADGEVDDESEGGVHQFATAVELGTLDFGASINFNLVGSAAYKELRDDLIAEADGIVVDENIAPVANPDTDEFTVAPGGSVVIQVADLLRNDNDPDGDNAELTIVNVFQGPNGTNDGVAELSEDGTFITFTAAAGYEGNAIFGYTLSDGEDTDTAVVTGTVTAGGDGFQVVPISVDNDGATIDADVVRTGDNNLQFVFVPQEAGDDGAIVRFSNFGAEDQLKTNVAIDDDSYVFGTPAADQIQLGFDWSQSPDSYLVYLQGVDEALVDAVETAIGDGDTDQQIIDLIGGHADFSSDWLVA